MTTFARLDELGLEVVGQRLEPDRAVLACRVVLCGGVLRLADVPAHGHCDTLGADVKGVHDPGTRAIEVVDRRPRRRLVQVQHQGRGRAVESFRDEKQPLVGGA